MSDLIIFGITFLFFIVLFYALSARRKAWNNWVKQAEPTAFHALDEIINGKRWIGSNLRLVHSSTRPTAPNTLQPGSSLIEQLCKANSGEYILLSLIIDGRRKTCRIECTTVLDSNSAKRWLEHDKEVYISEFGPVENA
jgi:hypothetical protein